jgi:hypothetical protein
MIAMQVRLLRRLSTMAALAALSLSAACDNNPSGGNEGEEVAVVVNSVDNTLSIVPLEEGGGARTVGLASAASSPVDLAVRGATAVVPLGIYPFAAVVDLRTATVTHRVALPANSGATGVAFLNDTVALVSNPGRNTISPVRVRSGQAGAEVAVGVYPEGIIVQGGRVFVLNRNLVNFAPAGPGSITVLNSALGAVKTIQLSGLNPASGVVMNNRLYVINSGRFGQASGSLSVINLQSLTEEAHYTGFGQFPRSITGYENSGLLYIGGFGYGLTVWDTNSRQFIVSPSSPVKPGGVTDVGDVLSDDNGGLFITAPGSCADVGKLIQIGRSGNVTRQVSTGTCPLGIALTEIPDND